LHSEICDKDELQSPQADVRDGEDVVVAHVATPGLRCIAHKVFVFISPNPLSRYDEHHHPEDEDHGQPYAPKDGGVLVDPPLCNQFGSLLWVIVHLEDTLLPRVTSCVI
uniref:Uncharacterized protein n=1 Tax=Periophthalmus magnuspinnatus TaxID=409849 RepID=A0A3B4AYE9_9GOBI